jgi:hypothetical protein
MRNAEGILGDTRLHRTTTYVTRRPAVVGTVVRLGAAALSQAAGPD